MGEEKKEAVLPYLGKEMGRLEGSHFYLAQYEFGIVFHSFNYMSTIIYPGSTSAYQRLTYFIENKKLYESLPENEKDLFEQSLSVVVNVLSIPMIAFNDFECTVNYAKEHIKNIDFLWNKYSNKALQEETPQENQTFMQAVLGMEEIKKSVENKE